MTVEKYQKLPKSPEIANFQAYKEIPSPRRVEQIKKAERIFEDSINDRVSIEKEEKKPLLEKGQRRYTV